MTATDFQHKNIYVIKSGAPSNLCSISLSEVAYAQQVPAATQAAVSRVVDDTA